jgi:hypothetical protein
MNAAIDIPPRVAIRNLSTACYTNGWTQFHYRADRIADVTMPGFFADAGTFTSPGDHISVSAPDGGALLLVVDADNAVAPIAMVQL